MPFFLGRIWNVQRKLFLQLINSFHGSGSALPQTWNILVMNFNLQNNICDGWGLAGCWLWAPRSGLIDFSEAGLGPGVEPWGWDLPRTGLKGDGYRLELWLMSFLKVDQTLMLRRETGAKASLIIWWGEAYLNGFFFSVLLSRWIALQIFT